MKRRFSQVCFSEPIACNDKYTGLAVESDDLEKNNNALKILSNFLQKSFPVSLKPTIIQYEQKLQEDSLDCHA